MNGRRAGTEDVPPLRGPGLIVTADDFGLHPSVNAAVECAHREGILTTASLMVGASATGDAIARARALPGLRVGLHVVLADGPSVLPPRHIPDLVDAHGRFGARMARDGVRFFCLPHVRRQLALEIRAQFEAFAASGLPLDHVNAHKHFHLHPTILSLVIRIGREFGMRAVRLPREAGPPQASSLWLRPWMALLAARLDAAGIVHNDYVIGIRQSGRFDERALLESLQCLPAAGIGEVYLHPALDSGAAVAPSMRDYRHADEFAALVSPRVRDACADLRARGWRLGGFADLLDQPDGIAAEGVVAAASNPPPDGTTNRASGHRSSDRRASGRAPVAATAKERTTENTAESRAESTAKPTPATAAIHGAATGHPGHRARAGEKHPGQHPGRAPAGAHR